MTRRVATGGTGTIGQRPRDLLDACSAVILDFDDTMAATFEVRSRTLLRALAEAGAPTTHQRIAAAWGAPFEALVTALAPGVRFADFLPRYARAMAEDPPRLLPGVRELLTTLAGRQTPVVVHTSGHTELVRQDIEALRIAALVLDVYGSDRTGAAKPDPASLRPVLDRLDAARRHRPGLLYSGDSVRDFEVAHGNGVRFLGVLTGRTSEAEFRAAGCTGALVGSYSTLFG